MANQRRKRNSKRTGKRGRQQDSGIARILRFGAIPFIVFLLIIIIMVMDRGEEDSSLADNSSMRQEAAGELEEPENGMGHSINSSDVMGDGNTTNPDGPGAEGESAEGDGVSGNQAGGTVGDGDVFDGQTPNGTGDEAPAIAQADPSQYPLQQDAILELTGLVQSYCEAKKECDPDLLAWVFGLDGWSEEEKEGERSRMELVKASVKSYENISCYSVQGPEENSYVIFPYYEIRYRETETLMPSFSWGYARTDESGRYYMVLETSEDVNEYIRKVGEKSEVKAVMAQIQARQQEAIGSDEVLQKIYGTAGESEVVIGGVMQ